VGKEKEQRVQISLRIPKSLDRAVELAVASSVIIDTKQKFIEDAIRASLQSRKA
jgi:hypothetical protein